MARNYFYNDLIYKKVNPENKMILEDYILEMKANGKAKGTIKQYTADIKMFFCYCYNNFNNANILELKKRDFRKFFLKLQENEASPARVNRVQCSLRNLLEFVVNDNDEEYDYEINIMRNIKGQEKKEVREIYFLTDEQITILIDALIKKKKYQKALYVSLSFDSAARRNEVFQVLKAGFLNNKKTNIVHGKRGKKFPLLYFSRTREIAKLYFEQRGNDDIDSLWIVGKDDDKRPADYTTLYNWVLSFRKVLEQETGEYIPFNPHSFRHSSLEAYKNGTHYSLRELGLEKLDLNILKILAHHEDISTTENYLKNQDEQLLFETFGL
jgi:integrase